MTRTSKKEKKVNEMIQGNEVAAIAPVTGVVYNTDKVAKFNTALPTMNNDEGPLCFTAVTVFKGSFEADKIDQLEAVLENVEEYNKRKHGNYKDYLSDCDHIQISGHLVTNSWEDQKKNKHTSIEIVADMIDFEED